MVNPAFSESQLKNLRRQNRHLVSTHRRKLVFLQASRNPAHGSGRPFFVRDVPVPASFCPAFALPAPVSAAPQLRPFCRPHRFCPRLPASPARRTEFGFVLCALPFRIPARHPGNGPARHLSVRPLSLRPSGSRFRSSGRSAVPSASALVFQPLPHAGQSSDSFCARCRSASPPGTPGTVPSQHLSIRPSPLRLPFPQLPSSDRSAVLTASALVFQPLPHAGQSSGPYCACCRSASPPGTPGMVPSRHLSARLLSLQPSPLRLPFPQLHPFCRPHRFCLRLPASPARRTEFGFVLCALPFRFPARHPGNGPARHLSARLLSLQPSPLRLPALAAPQLRPFRRPLRFCPRLPASPARRTEFGFVLCALPFRIPARHPGNGPVPASFYSAFAPPAPVSAAPQLRPFCRPHRFCPRLPASPARRTKFGSVLCTLPFRITARHPGNGPVRHLSARPSPLRLPLPPLRRFRSFPPRLRPSPRRPAEPAAPSARHAKRAV